VHIQPPLDGRAFMGSGPRLRELGLPRGCLPVVMATPVAGRLLAEHLLADQQHQSVFKETRLSREVHDCPMKTYADM